MKRITLTLIIFCVIIFRSAAQDSLSPHSLNLEGYIKNLNTSFIQDNPYQWLTENMIHNRLDLKYSHESGFGFHAGLRNRLIYGEFVKYFPAYSSLIDEEKGWLDLSRMVVNNKYFLLHSTIDRLYFDYSKGSFAIRIGRQRINWSQTFVWNPNDIFNAYNFFDFDYEIKPGSDAVKMTFYTGAVSQLEAAVKSDYLNRITAAAMFRFNHWNYDFQVIGGMMNDKEIVGGAGWSGQLFKGGFRGEASCFYNNEKEDSNMAVLASIGYEYVFKNSLMLMGEALYNSQGIKKGTFNLNEFYYHDLSAKTLSLTQWSFLLMASYPLSPLLSCSFSAMYSPNNPFLFLGPSLSYSAADNLTVSLNAQAFSGLNTAENTGGFVFLVFKWGF
ncbi:MAG TPA: hypothetical protein P5050_04395 [Bacteroidia bacterium]|mgnify:CR=1 FL=1|nr:hypothetical protein [Bacteroidia bacterium]HRS58441.1 hypothetical protein [Bacteroidia bacterium]HRU69392.1 hypothetical protein [Bacteroidia bacterium]